MLIKSLSVKNFRSIKKAELPIYNCSILIGPNNEGKSNILQALILTLKCISDSAEDFYHVRRSSFGYPSRRNRESDRTKYDWERDYPIGLQKIKPNGNSIFIVIFELNSRERYSFKRLTKINLKGDLRVKLFLSRNREPVFEVCDISNPRNKIRLSDEYEENWERVTSFFERNLVVQYISAIRTSETTRNVVDNMIYRELVFLQRKQERKLLERLRKIQKPALNRLSKGLKESVSNFLPDIKNIDIELEHGQRFRRIMQEPCKVIVDDGTKTDLDLKGDGIKSLLAISIIQHAALRASLNKNILLAIEEPETHLHPASIHELKKVLEDISLKNQVIITTHSPLLINRSSINKNLLVDKSEARAAKSIAEVRDLLGVLVSDNLTNANLVILVEGKYDAKIIETWISSMSDKIKSAIHDGIVVFDNLGGGSNLSYKTTQWKSLLCDVFIFLDKDAAGEGAYLDAESKGLITEKEVCFANLMGFKESEIEDLVENNTYKDIISEKFGITFECSQFRNNKKKWSSRLKDTFINQGKRWPEGRENELKDIVSEEVHKKGIDSLKKSGRSCIETMTRHIEEYIESK